MKQKDVIWKSLLNNETETSVGPLYDYMTGLVQTSSEEKGSDLRPSVCESVLL